MPPAEPVADAPAGPGVPKISYPAELPVSQRRNDLLAAIRDHQVVIVAGETGSGKTTQLPKMCLELGRGAERMIGHTQPRRIAARAVAERIAEELGTELGTTVGYQVRFSDRSGDATRVKVMTDGILLAEIQHDRMLWKYDTIIIDEAHERSLNVDFLLGYLKQLLPRRPDLKLIVTSATIDPERFSRHFDDAPVIEVSGRMYPVEIRYRPLVDGEEQRDQVQGICDAVMELDREAPGDVLVFCSGEREIRDAAEALRAMSLRDTEILPLYARLSAAEQHRVFTAHSGRRIVLATNVAETSLTVPGIRYVVDPGTARISRYSHRTKVQRLPIEPISQASASQRAGRCGRLADGICIRLYAEEDFRGRPEFTDPEILRTSLASVILQMAALGLGDVAAFPFVEPPDRRGVAAGVQLLQELGALQPSQPGERMRLTPLGKRLARLPIDPRLARMVIEADTNGCVREVAIVAAALSIQDPRERPADAQQAADAMHARFAEPDSDFVGYLRLWEHVQERQRELSSSRFRRMCRDEFLNYLRIREWQDLVGQLRQVAKGLRITWSSAPDDAKRLHQSLLAGLLSHIGLRDPEKRDYLGARGARFALWPGSSTFKKQPRWVMAGELVETSRLWGRDVARVEPEWIERLAGDLVQRTYSEPHWSRERGAVMAVERVTLYGVPLVAGRRVTYGRIDPVLSRELFIRHALVEGDWDTRHRFFHDNQALLADVADLEERARRRDIVVDDETLFRFYDARVGPDVVSARHFDRWWKDVRRAQPDLLSFTVDLLVGDAAGGVREADFPDEWVHGDLRLPLHYRFEPGAADDGVTVDIPLTVLNRVDGAGFDWLVPGLREDLVTALIRLLPKAIRRSFVPAPNYAKTILATVPHRQEPLLDVLSRELQRMGGAPVPYDAWDVARLPAHLRMTLRVVRDDGRVVGSGKDLAALRRQLTQRVTTELAKTADDLERAGLTSWEIGTLPRTHQRSWQGHLVQGYPALVDEGGSVAVRVLPSEAEQRAAMWAGTRRLLLLGCPSPAKAVLRGLDNRTKLTLSRGPHGSAAALFADCTAASVDLLMVRHGGVAWDAAGFARLLAAVRADLPAQVAETVALVRPVVDRALAVESRLADLGGGPGVRHAVEDVRAQLDGLVHDGFVTAAGVARLPDIARYLQAIERRLEKLPHEAVRDRQRLAGVQHVQECYANLLGALPPERRADDAIVAIRWMIEELRVSVFAQALGTPHPVSEKRILRAMDALG